MKARISEAIMKNWAEHYGQKPHEGLMTREEWGATATAEGTTVISMGFEGRGFHCSNTYRFHPTPEPHHELVEGDIPEAGENAKNLAIGLSWAVKEHLRGSARPA